MNSNLFRTLLTFAAAAAVLLPVFFGCTSIADGSFDCSASWIGPKLAGFLAMALMGIGTLVKWGDGTGLFSTSSTTFRTILTGLAFVVTLAMVVFGCSTDAVTGAIACSAGWLSPQLAGVVAGVLLGINQMVKTFDGTTLTKPVTK